MPEKSIKGVFKKLINSGCREEFCYDFALSEIKEILQEGELCSFLQKVVIPIIENAEKLGVFKCKEGNDEVVLYNLTVGSFECIKNKLKKYLLLEEIK